MSLLSMESITGGYGEADILHGVSLRVDAGEIVVIVGPNGAGKSTAMKAIFGLLRLRSGRILFDDQVPPARMRPEHRFDRLLFIADL